MSERIVGRFGRMTPKRPEGLHQLASYQTNPLPPAPASVGVPAVPNWLMLANDKYGDCTFAGVVHARMATAQIDGVKFKPPSDKTVVNEYLKFTNGRDAGAVEADLLQHWQTQGLFNTKIAGYAPTDKADYDELKSVINTFGLAYIGILVPAPAMDQFRNHQPWHLTGTPADQQIEGGHCVILVGYDNDHFYCITWGEVQAVTKQWLQCYMEESWAIITPEITKAGKLKDFRLADLQADIAKLKA
jgi:hypothetical protein